VHIAAGFLLETDDDTWIGCFLDVIVEAATRSSLKPSSDLGDCVGGLMLASGATVGHRTLKRLVERPEQMKRTISKPFATGSLEVVNFIDPVLSPESWALSLVLYHPLVDGLPVSAGALSITMPTKDPMDNAAASQVTDLLVKIVSLDPRSGGAISDAGHEFGTYGRAAGVDRDSETFRGTTVLDYGWQVLLPPMVVADLGGLGAVEQEAPVESLVVAEWPSGGEGAVCAATACGSQGGARRASTAHPGSRLDCHERGRTP